MQTKLVEIVPGIAMGPALPDADALLREVSREIVVTDELVASNSGAVPMPRQTGWYGDPNALYTYSGITRNPRPWTPALAALRDRLNVTFEIAVNSCLVGVYTDGSNSVDWHADDEPELRDRIISVSLGAQRVFMLREQSGSAAIAVPLRHGSIVVMTVASQRTWQHALPAEPGAGRRINLTFRVIAPV